MEEGPVRMFMSQIPRFMRENEIRLVLEEFGPVAELTLIRDRNTGESHGCCYVTFNEHSSARSALEALHMKRTLATMSRPIEVFHFRFYSKLDKCSFYV